MRTHTETHSPRDHMLIYAALKAWKIVSKRAWRQTPTHLSTDRLQLAAWKSLLRDPVTIDHDCDLWSIYFIDSKMVSALRFQT